MAAELLLDKYKKYTSNIIQDLIEDLNLNSVKRILYTGQKNSYIEIIIAQQFTGAIMEYSFSDAKFDLIISAEELACSADPIGYFKSLKAHLNYNGAIIGFLLGEESLFETRKVLWELDEKHSNKLAFRINAMIRVQDLTSIMQNIGFKNILSFIDSHNIEFQNLNEILQIIRVNSKNSLLHKPEYMSKYTYLAIINSNEKFVDRTDILSFSVIPG